MVVPSGSNWLHEVKHEGYQLMARRDPVGVRPADPAGNDWSNRFPLVVEAVDHLKVRPCLIDGRWCAAMRGAWQSLDTPSAAERGPRVPVRLRPTRDGRP
jgi:ATP-dependent DNA ligase